MEREKVEPCANCGKPPVIIQYPEGVLIKCMNDLCLANVAIRKWNNEQKERKQANERIPEEPSN